MSNVIWTKDTKRDMKHSSKLASLHLNVTRAMFGQMTKSPWHALFSSETRHTIRILVEVLRCDHGGYTEQCIAIS